MTKFRPKDNVVKAVLTSIYNAKFDKLVPLAVLLLSIVYVIYRTGSYLSIALHLNGWIAWPTSVFIELLVLGSAAATLVARRYKYITELRQEDTNIAQVGVVLSIIMLVAAFLALLFIAWNDAFIESHKNYITALILSLVQVVQMLMTINLIVGADIDSRESLRNEFKAFEAREAKKREADERKKLVEDEQRRAEAHQAELERKMQEAQLQTQLAREAFERDNPFVCDVCKDRKATRKALSNHMRSHRSVVAQ